MPITIKDIAKKANVSSATVSLVLNNKKGVGEETRKKVLEIAKQHNYLPKKKKLSRKLNIQFTINMKQSKIVNETPFFHNLIEGIEEATKHESCGLFITYLSQGTSLASLISEDKKEFVDGVLLLATEMQEDELIGLDELGVPIVILDCCFINIDAHYVVIDNFKGTFKAIMHLAEMGHSDIGYLKGRVDIENFKERFEGYQYALKESLLEYNPDYTILLNPMMNEAYNDMLEYLEDKPKLPTAFIADNDNIALGAMKALKEMGYMIPQDVSIIGFDDMPFCTMVNPMLTSVKVDMEYIGEHAIENLIDQIKHGSKYYTKTAIGTSIVQRDSVKRIL